MTQAVSRLLLAVALGLLARAAAAAEPLRLDPAGAVALALARDYTVQIERLGPEVAAGAAEAAAGAFDPALTAAAARERRRLEGAPAVEATVAEAGVAGLLPGGAAYAATVAREEPDDAGATTRGTLSLTQPLLRGAWAGSVVAVRVARRQREQSEWFFRAALTDQITETLVAYHNLYFARQNLAVAERSRDLARKLLADNRRRVELGALAPVDALVAEAELALREEALLSLQAFARAQENRLKARLFAGTEGLLETVLEIAPPTPGETPDPRPGLDLARALSLRPDYQAALLGVEIRDVELAGARQDRLPGLDASAYWDGRLDGPDDGLPKDTYGVRLSLRQELPGRSARGALRQAQARRQQAGLGLEQLRQDILLELDSAAAALLADWNRIAAARRARELAAQSLAGEESKLQAGTSTTFVVLRLQQDLAAAEIGELRALTDYRNRRAEYDRALGATLLAWNVSAGP